MSTRRPDEPPRAPASDARVAIEQVVNRYSELPRGAVRQWTPGAISDLDGSILFVLALWSGTSLARFRVLTGVLAQAPSAPSLAVVDIDALTPEVLRPLESRLRGVGEMYWVRGERIVASITDADLGALPELIAANNRLLRP